MNLQQLLRLKTWVAENEPANFSKLSEINHIIKNYSIENIDTLKNDVEQTAFNPSGDIDLYVADLTWLTPTWSLNNTSYADELNFFGIVENYKNAANSLVKSGKSLPDGYFYAIMFCYMQYLELVLKALIVKTDCNCKDKSLQKHNILNLWNCFKRLIFLANGSLDESRNKYNYSIEEIKIADAIINGLFSNNSNSMDFRYLKELSGIPYLAAGYKVDFAVVSCWMDILDDFFYRVYGESN